MTRMTAGEKIILEKLVKIIPKLSNNKKEYFLGIIDGMGIATDKNESPRKPTDENKQAS